MFCVARSACSKATYCPSGEIRGMRRMPGSPTVLCTRPCRSNQVSWPHEDSRDAGRGPAVVRAVHEDPGVERPKSRSRARRSQRAAHKGQRSRSMPCAISMPPAPAMSAPPHREQDVARVRVWRQGVLGQRFHVGQDLSRRAHHRRRRRRCHRPSAPVHWQNAECPSGIGDGSQRAGQNQARTNVTCSAVPRLGDVVRTPSRTAHSDSVSARPIAAGNGVGTSTMSCAGPPATSILVDCP